MAVSDYLDFLQITDTQTQKMAAISQLAEQIGQNLAAQYTLDVSTAVSSSTDEFLLPYDNTNDLSDRSGIRYIYLKITGSPTVDVYVFHPLVDHMFFIENETAQAVYILPYGGNYLQNPSIPAGAGNIIYCNATAERCYAVLPDQRTSWWPMECQFWGKPAASEEMGRLIMPKDVTILEDTTEIVGRVTTNPTARYDINVYEQTNKRGEVQISTGGVFTFVTSASSDTLIEAGNELIFYAPSTVDATIEDIRFSINGRVVVA